jgi:LPPG:FO 2-phospho-L-lactate transferase
VITLLSGGLRGNKFLEGLLQVTPQEELTIVVNAVNNIEICGLDIFPDLENMLFLLAGKLDIREWQTAESSFRLMNALSNKIPTLSYLIDRDWENIKDDTHSFMDAFSYLMNEDEFYGYFGDTFFAHVIFREYLMTKGKSFSEAIGIIAEKLDIKACVLPTTDDKITLKIVTDQGKISLLEYRDKEIKGSIKEIKEIEFDGINNAKINSKVEDAFSNSDLILIGPCNPLLNVLLFTDYLPTLRPIEKAIEKASGNVIAISPVSGDEPIEQPLWRVMEEAVGFTGEVPQIAKKYQGLIDVLVINESDEKYKEQLEEMGIQVVVTNVNLGTQENRTKLGEIISRLVHTYLK